MYLIKGTLGSLQNNLLKCSSFRGSDFWVYHWETLETKESDRAISVVGKKPDRIATLTCRVEKVMREHDLRESGGAPVVPLERRMCYGIADSLANIITDEMHKFNVEGNLSFGK